MVRKRIFVVDDEEASRTEANAILGSTYNTHMLESTEDMFDLLSKLDAENKLPDLILMDIHMPGKEREGIKAVNKLKNNVVWKDIPVIYITGYQPDNTTHNILLDKAFESGAWDVIHKPFLRPLMLKRAENCLNFHQATM